MSKGCACAVTDIDAVPKGWPGGLAAGGMAAGAGSPDCPSRCCCELAAGVVVDCPSRSGFDGHQSAAGCPRRWRHRRKVQE